MKALIVAFILFAGSCLSTQKLAKSLNYDPLIGDYLFRLGSDPIYNPFSFFIWYFEFGHVVPKLFRSASIYLISSILLILVIAIISKPKRKSQLHGSASWLPHEKLQETGYRDPKGVFLGHIKEGFKLPFISKHLYFFDKSKNILFMLFQKLTFLVNNGDQHLVVIAPSRAGKGIGIIIPTLLGTWQESVVISDIKNENFEETSGYRQKVMGQHVLRFAPTAGSDEIRSRFNPLNEISWGTKSEYLDVQNMCNILIGQPAKGEQSHWKDNAKALLTACIIHCKYKQMIENSDGELTLQDITLFLKGTVEVEDLEDGSQILKPVPFKETLKRALNFNHLPVKNVPIFNNNSNLWEYHDLKEDHFETIFKNSASLIKYPKKYPAVLTTFVSFIGKSDNESAGVLSSTLNPLEVFNEPIVAENTSQSDFFIKDIMRSDKPVALYLFTPPPDLIRVGPLFKIIIELMVQKNTQKLKQYKHKCLLLLDEFASFGRLAQVETGLGFIAGYGLKVMMILQGLPQLNQIYGEENLIMTGSHIQVYFAPNDLKTKEYIAKSLGKETIEYETTSQKGFMEAKNVSQNLAGRDLLTATEVGELDEDIIIYQTRKKSVKIPKFYYFKDPEFIQRNSYKEATKLAIIKQKLDPNFAKKDLRDEKLANLLVEEETDNFDMEDTQLVAQNDLASYLLEEDEEN